jgi:hypothetical protein
VPGAAARSRDTYLSAQFWRLARRVGKKKAAVAVGHSILVICWHLLTNNCDYDDLGGDYFARRTNPDRHRDHLIERLHTLGYRVSTKSHERTATRSTGDSLNSVGHNRGHPLPMGPSVHAPSAVMRLDTGRTRTHVQSVALPNPALKG